MGQLDSQRAVEERRLRGSELLSLYVSMVKSQSAGAGSTPRFFFALGHASLCLPTQRERGPGGGEVRLAEDHAAKRDFAQSWYPGRTRLVGGGPSSPWTRRHFVAPVRPLSRS